MKRKLVKKCGSILVALSLLTQLTVTSFASNSLENKNDDENEIKTGYSEIVPFAEQTKYYYTTVNGKCHRKLWSVTYGYWIDPAWRLCPSSSHKH